MSILGAALVKLGAQISNRRVEPHSTDVGSAIEAAPTPVPAAPSDGYSKAAMIDELRALGALTEAQLKKVAMELSPEEATASAKRLKSLEESAPSPGKMLRGAAVGAAVQPLASLAFRAAAGPKFRMGAPISLGPRVHMANAAQGAIFGSLMPAGQHKLETEVEKQKLREYLGTHPKGTIRGRIKGMTGL